MDSDSPISRVERTFWTVWNYITEAVNRFLRPEPANIPSNDANSIQESAVDNQPANYGHAEGEASRVDEEQPLATASLLSSSRPLVAWELCTTDINLGPDEESVQYKTSEESEGTREEQFARTGNDDAGLFVANDARAKEGENRQEETPEDDECEEHKSLRLTGDAMSEDVEDGGRKTGAEKTERAMTLDGTNKTLRNSQGKEADDKMLHEDLQVEERPITDLSQEEEDDVQLEEAKVQIKSDEEARNVEVEWSEDNGEFKGDPGFTSPQVELQMSNNKSSIVFEGELIVVEQEHVMAHSSESDKVEDAKDEDERILGEGAVSEEEMKEASNNQAINEAPEQEDNINVAEDSQEEEVLTVTLSEEVMHDGKTELHTDEEAEDNGLQTTTRETKDVEGNEKSDMTTMHISVDERCFDKDQTEEEISSEADNKNSSLEVAISVMVRPEGETGQEMSGEFKNIPPRVCEGQVVVPQELNPPACEETQEGVPEYNNELVDENTTQRFLEDGDCEEIQGILPEEVESSGTRADHLLLREHMKEEQESTHDIKNNFEENAGILHLTDVGLLQETEEPLVEAVTQESRLEKEELLVDFMKTEVEHSEKQLELDFSFLDKTEKTTKEPQDGTEELLVEFEIDKGLCESKSATGGDCETFLEAEVPKMTETSFLQELVDAMNSEQNSNVMASLREDGTDFGFLKQSSETKLLEDIEMQDAGIDMEETGYRVLAEKEAAEDGLENKDEMQSLRLQEVRMAESELSRSVESIETNLMLAEAPCESTTAKSRPKDWTLPATEGVAMHEENTKESICGHQDVIDEEILDLWIQAALSEDSVGIQQEEPEPGRQQMEPANEGQDEIPSEQTEKDTEQLVDLVSDTEMSSLKVESGFLDQSLGEWSTESSEILKSAGSFQGLYDMLESISESADVSEFSAQPSKSFISTVETGEMGQLDLKQEEVINDSGVISAEDGHQNQESQKERDGESVEPVETETGSQKEADAEETGWKDTKEADVKSDMTDSPDEIQHAESGPRSGSEVSETVLSESGSQIDSKSETKFLKLPSVDEPQPTWPEDIAESLARVGGAEQLVSKTEDQMEVDAFTLDFTAQRSRIAVKNPRVRPPKDPRSLLHMPSLDPTPSSHPPVVKAPAGVPLGGLGIGIKLPGFGAGFPVLKKTQQVVTDENSPENLSQETKPEEKNDTPEHDEAQQKPKWMPPKHPGFGNPLMSELKTKLKKSTKD